MGYRWGTRGCMRKGFHVKWYYQSINRISVTGYSWSSYLECHCISITLSTILELHSVLIPQFTAILDLNSTTQQYITFNGYSKWYCYTLLWSKHLGTILGIPIIKIRRSHDRRIFIMEVHTHGRTVFILSRGIFVYSYSYSPRRTVNMLHDWGEGAATEV